MVVERLLFSAGWHMKNMMQLQMPSGHLLLLYVKMAATAKIGSFAYLR